MSIRIAVFEDDRPYAAWLERIIRQHTHHPTAINTGAANEIISWIQQASGPILYLLDIVADGEAVGFEIARSITERQDSSLIVFITAHPQQIKYKPLFKTMAFSIILKNAPLLEQEIKETITLAAEALQTNCFYIHIGKHETLYIPHQKICFVEAVKGTNKLCIHCTDGQYVIRETLKNLQEQLMPFGFIRCHKSILVNKANIRKQDRSTRMLTLHNGSTCPYSYLMQGGLNSF